MKLRWILKLRRCRSSALTGDVSNSYRLADLPILDHAYVVYGLSWHRSQAEAVHNVGHQFEAMFSYINNRQDGNTRLFWHDFVGQDDQDQFITGRAGWTHMPPNTTQNYDHLNPTVVASDIEDRRLDGLGSMTQVSVNTWALLQFDWPGAQDFPQRVETQWYTYWMQSFPGAGNRIPYGGQWMTNWWAIFADWDTATTSGLGLYGSTPAATSGTGVPFASPSAKSLSPVPRAEQVGGPEDWR